MIQGKLKWFDPKKGYGFIKPDDGDKRFLAPLEWRYPVEPIYG